MITPHTDEKKPADAGVDEVADRIAERARTAFRLAKQHPDGSHERRFIEHGAMCYFNCWSMLKESQGASVPQPSTIPAAQ